MSTELQNLIAATIMATASTLSGFGAGFLYGFITDTESGAKRLACICVGLLTTLVMLNAMIWLGYHGFKY